MLFERKRESNDFIAERHMKFEICYSKKMPSNMLTVESSCGIEPQSLASENLTIRPWRFTRTEVVCDKSKWAKK